MREARACAWSLIWSDAKSIAWLPNDVLVQGANAVLCSAVALGARRIDGAWCYVALHLAIAAALYWLARHDVHDAAKARRAGPALVTLLHHWLPVAFLPVVYFELGTLIPQLHPFDAHRGDRALQAIDVWLLGDPVAWIARLAWAPLSDLLAACYVSYYALPLVLPALLYARGSRAAFQRVATIIVTALLLCYAGYFLLPAVGPHVLFDGYRPVALDGHGFARYVYALLRSVPLEPPDAFPSGHTLISVLLPTLAFQYARPLFFVLAPLSFGIVLATVYLRFHYLADVVAALLLAPLVYKLGAAIERRLFGPALARVETSAGTGYR
jgi:membrane-associated phospholipid phosphatase